MFPAARRALARLRARRDNAGMNAPATVATAEPRTAEPVVADVERIAPAIRAAADEAERARRLPPTLLDALHEAGLFRMLLPRRFGGAEMPLPRYMPVIEAVAKIDGSAAWCLGQGNGCAMTAAFLAPSVSREIWGDDPRAVLAWGPGKGSAAPRNGGYDVSGQLGLRQRDASRHLARRHVRRPRGGERRRTGADTHHAVPRRPR